MLQDNLPLNYVSEFDLDVSGNSHIESPKESKLMYSHNSPPKTAIFSVDLNQTLTARMQSFIQWALNQTRSKDYSTDEILSLLDEAWQAQKQLWQLRNHSDN
jgi:hypothetical protein